jgi:DNA-binding NtrC family response regulator
MAVTLIVEDDAFIRDGAEMLIQDWDPRTLLAGDVDEALSLQRSLQHIDALFTDIYLKTAILGRCELAHQAIERRLKHSVLYTTGNSIADKMKAPFVEGAHLLYQRMSNITSKTRLKGCSKGDFEVAQPVR